MKSYYNDAFDFINSFHPISEDIFKKIYELSEFKQFKTKTKIVNLGEVPRKMYFLTKGVLRSYAILDNGKELTKTLYTPMIFFASLKALLTQKESNLIYETLSDCDVFQIDYLAFDELCKSNLELMTFYSKLLEFLFIKVEEKYMETLALSASSRYLSLRKRIPNIDNLIPQYQIAASLGVTPVQLSRIRAKL